MGVPITKKLVISGYYGFKNSGDEAVLQSILLALKAQAKNEGTRIEPIVLSIDPPLTEKMYGVKAVHRMRPAEVYGAIKDSEGLISGGGSLLQDATSAKSIPYYLGVIKIAQFLKKPTFIYSQGIGPVQRKLFYSWIRGVFNHCQYVSVRDQESAELLRTMGCTAKVEVVPDPVMGLPLNEQKTSANNEQNLPVVGVSVRFWNEDRSELESIAQCLQELRRERKVLIRFLPFHLPEDLEASLEVIRRMKAEDDPLVQVVEHAEHPQDMLAEVGQCDLLVGMRLHSLIYAASQYVPMLGISYDPKIDQFLQRLQMKAAATTRAFQVDQVGAELSKLLEGKKTWVSEKRILIDQLKKDAELPAKQILAWITREKVNA